MSEVEEREVTNAYVTLALYGVPRERARSIANGIQVLMSRIDKERMSIQLAGDTLKKAAEALLKLIDDLNKVDGAQTDRVFALYEFDELRTAIKGWVA